jgi:hypothetical protein
MERWARANYRSHKFHGKGKRLLGFSRRLAAAIQLDGFRGGRQALPRLPTFWQQCRYSGRPRPLSDGGCLNVSRIMGWPQTCEEAPEAPSTSQYCTVIGQHSGSVVK